MEHIKRLFKKVYQSEENLSDALGLTKKYDQIVTPLNLLDEYWTVEFDKEVGDGIIYTSDSPINFEQLDKFRKTIADDTEDEIDVEEYFDSHPIIYISPTIYGCKYAEVDLLMFAEEPEEFDESEEDPVILVFDVTKQCIRKDKNVN